MLRFHSPFNGKRFIGDNRLKIFHDSLYETPSSEFGGCRIDHIPAEEVRTFDPDTIGEAERRRLVHCPCCRHNDRSLNEEDIAEHLYTYWVLMASERQSMKYPSREVATDAAKLYLLNSPSDLKVAIQEYDKGGSRRRSRIVIRTPDNSFNYVDTE